MSDSEGYYELDEISSGSVQGCTITARSYRVAMPSSSDARVRVVCIKKKTHESSAMQQRPIRYPLAYIRDLILEVR